MYLSVRIIEAVVAVIVIGEICFAVFTLFRNSVLKRRYGACLPVAGFSPHCSVVIPTKGLPRNGYRNFVSYVTQDYADYRVFFVVERDDDEGVPVLRRITAEHEHASLVIAGFTESGCQQNHNMIAGAKAAGETDVLVFADNDIAPDNGWLRQLIKPLASERVTVSTAYRWLRARSGILAEHAHVFMNMTLYVHFTIFSSLAGKLLWGGSFALRKKDYDELDVALAWNKTVSDDMSLTNILVKHKKTAYLIPGFLIETDDVIEGTRDTVTWFVRQLLNVKACQYSLWAYVILPVMLLVMLLYVLFPVALLGALVTDVSFRGFGGIASLTFIAGEMILCMFYGMLGPTRRHAKAVLTTPLLRLHQVIAAVLTIGGTSLCWSGVEYHFNRNGTITRIERQS